MSGNANAVAAQARSQLKGEKAAIGAEEFRTFLAGIVTGVLEHVLDVRSGKLKPEEASELDDATVRTLAQILMDEHEKIGLDLKGCGPKPGPELVDEIKRNLPALFRDLPEGTDAGNPRALMVHAARVFLRDIYSMIRSAAKEGDDLSVESLKIRIDRVAAVWAERFLGDSLGEAPAKTDKGEAR